MRYTAAHRTLLASLEKSGSCAYPAGSLEELSRAVQLRHRLPEYHAPILVGYSSGATLVYALLAQDPPETFRGAISLGFCPDLDTRVAPCQTRGLRASPRAKGLGYDLAPYPGLAVPWHVLQGDADRVCDPSATQAFVAATGSARLHALPTVGHGFAVMRRWEPAFLEAYRAIVASTPPSAAAFAILRRALEAPARQIAENSAVDGGVVVAKMLESENSVGFDAARKEYVDLYQAGIVDPTKVIRIGLENAVSVASTLLLTEATMTEIPEEKKAAAGMPEPEL